MKLKEYFGPILKTGCARRGVVLAQYTHEDRRERLQNIVRLKEQGRLLQNPADACQLISALRATKNIPGDIAEVGTAAGGSARLIGENSSGKTIHVFDTFEGLPKPDARDVGFVEGQYKFGLEDVQKYLAGLPVEFHKGLFPDSAASLHDHRFSFVHLDVDLYKSVTSCLQFFYPRLSPGGVLICHDYVHIKGVTQAVTDFFSDKPEGPIELIGHQALVIKFPPCGNA